MEESDGESLFDDIESPLAADGDEQSGPANLVQILSSVPTAVKVLISFLSDPIWHANKRACERVTEVLLVSTSCFSGFGTFEFVCRWTFDTFTEQCFFAQPGAPKGRMVMYSATEKKPSAMRALRCHNQCTRPRHLFSDILDRLPSQDREIAWGILRMHLRSFGNILEERKAERCSRDDVTIEKRRLTVSLLMELKRFFRTVTFEEKAWCDIHQGLCYISPRSDPELKFARWLDGSGHDCTPWSRAGSQRRWLHSSTLTTMVYFESLRFLDPDDVYFYSDILIFS